MSINSLYYTSLLCRVVSIFSLAVFFFSYWNEVDNRVLVLCLGISLLAWILAHLFRAYFEQVVARIAIAKHTAQQNAINEIVEEMAHGENNTVITEHPLFTEKEENNE